MNSFQVAGMLITLRNVEPEDDAFLFQVYASTRAAEMALVPWTDEQRATFLRMQFDSQTDYYRKQFPTADYKVILARGETVGRLYVLREESANRILDIALLNEHRRRGIGSSLIRKLLNEAQQANKALRIYVESFNPALSLFEELGFEQIAEDGINSLLEWKAAEVSS